MPSIAALKRGVNDSSGIAVPADLIALRSDEILGRAMSQEHVEVVRGSFTAFTRRDTTLFFELLDPDVVWIPLMASLEGRV